LQHVASTLEGALDRGG